MWPVLDLTVDMLLDDPEFHYYYTDTFEFYLENGIHNRMALHAFIRLFCGFDITRRGGVGKEPFCSPFDFVAVLFFQECRDALAMGSRASGKTLALAVLIYLWALFYPECETTTCAATKDQSSRAFLYLRKLCTSSNASNKLLSSKPTAKAIKWGNGSSVEMTTSSLEGANALHPSKLLADESELLDWRVVEEMLSCAISQGDIQASTVFLSSRKFLDGPFQRLLEMAKENPKTYKIFNWSAWQAVERCMRKCDDKVHGRCELQELCKGRLRKSDGHLDLEDFKAKVRLLSDEVLKSQWLNLKPVITSTVFNNYYEPEVSLISQPEDFHYDFTVCGIDWGSTKASNLVFQRWLVDVSDLRDDATGHVDVDSYKKPTLYLAYEYRSATSDMARLARAILESPYREDYELIFVDPSGKSLRNELARFGIETETPLVTGVQEGIEVLKGYLKPYWSGRKRKSCLYILDGYYHGEPDLEPTHKELQLMRHVTKPDGTLSQNIVKAHDHGVDAARYAITAVRSVIESLYAQDFDEDLGQLEQFAETFGIEILA